jgi:Bifunctional DNA primase/polymerase, N-terminal
VKNTHGFGNRSRMHVPGYTEADGKPVKLDIRGIGGQAAVEPSVHPAGHTYHWIVGLPQVDKLPEIPQALLDVLTAPNSRRS